MSVQVVDALLQDARLVRLAGMTGKQSAQFLDKDVELVPPLLL